MAGVLLPWVLGAVLAAEPVALGPDLSLETVMPGVTLVVHRFGTPCNSLLVNCGGGRFVWVDTPVTAEATARVLAWLERTVAEPNLIAINTGFHNDNLGGNAALIARGVPCYGSERTRRLLREVWPRTAAAILPFYTRVGDAAREAFLRNPVVGSDHTYRLEEGLRLRVGDESVEVHFPGPSHTRDNVVVWFARRRLLFGGCMIKAAAARSLGFTADADLAAWPRAVGRVAVRFPTARLVVPGHGPCGGRELLQHTIDLCTPTIAPPEP